MIYATYEEKNEYIRTSYNTNMQYKYATALARMRLHEILDKFSDNILYCDTDSVIYNETDEINEYLGDGLGQWTDELHGKYITYFASAQAKDHAMAISDGSCVGKVKGYAKNAEAEEKMTLEQRVKLILNSIGYQSGKNEMCDSVAINYDQFRLNYNTISTVKMLKQWGFKFDKRIN